MRNLERTFEHILPSSPFTTPTTRTISIEIGYHCIFAVLSGIFHENLNLPIFLKYVQDQ